MEEQNISAFGFGDGANEGQEPVVAAPQTEEGVSEPAEAAPPPPEAEIEQQEESRVEEPEPVKPEPQSREWNDAMKQARLAGQREREQAINEVYTARLAAAGITNPSTGKPFANLDEFANYSDAVAAANANMSLEQFRAQREEREQLRQAAAERDSLKAELAKVKMNGELAELKKKFPEIKAKDVLDLGEEFIRMRAVGVPPETAYRAILDTKAANTKPIPPSMGALSQQSPEREFFTSEELDALTQEELMRNPALLEKAMKSAERLGKN